MTGESPWLPPLIIDGELTDDRDCGDEIIYPPGWVGIGDGDNRDMGDEQIHPQAGMGGDSRSFGDNRIDP